MWDLLWLHSFCHENDFKVDLDYLVDGWPIDLENYRILIFVHKVYSNVFCFVHKVYSNVFCFISSMTYLCNDRLINSWDYLFTFFLSRNPSLNDLDYLVDWLTWKIVGFWSSIVEICTCNDVTLSDLLQLYCVWNLISFRLTDWPGLFNLCVFHLPGNFLYIREIVVGEKNFIGK